MGKCVAMLRAFEVSLPALKTCSHLHAWPQECSERPLFRGKPEARLKARQHITPCRCLFVLYANSVPLQRGGLAPDGLHCHSTDYSEAHQCATGCRLEGADARENQC